MTKRYFKRMWEEEYYIFDSEIVSEEKFDDEVQYEDYQAFADSMSGDEVVNRLNELENENKKLTLENKILYSEIEDIRDRCFVFLKCRELDGRYTNE